MRRILALFLMLFSYEWALFGASNSEIKPDKKIVTSTQRIYLPTYPGAYNPSLMRYGDGYLLTFRYLPNRSDFPWLSYIGIVRLNESFEQASPTQLLDTRFSNKCTPSQSEDARIFTCGGKIYVVYNDNMDFIFPSIWDRRDMYIAEIFEADNQFIITDPVKLVHKTKYPYVRWQKNWSPFDWNGSLFFIYSINPHEIIYPNLQTGVCQVYSETLKTIDWNFGVLRGSTPAQLVDGEYLTFFHSAKVTASPCSDNKEIWHYYMGAYTFSSEPPFEITKMSLKPIDAPSFYTYSNYDKRVIYPGGYVIEGSNLYIAYGKDDSETWIATIDLAALKESLVPLRGDSKK